MTEEELLSRYEILIEAIERLRKEAAGIREMYAKFSDGLEAAEIMYAKFRDDFEATETRIDDDVAQVNSRAEEISSQVDVINSFAGEIKSLRERVNALENRPAERERSPQPTRNHNNAETIKEYFESQGFEVVDKRPNKGALWVVGERDMLEEHVQYVRVAFGATGKYSEGNATGFRPAWYTKSDR